ncbi:MAG: ATP-dependent DNA ligase [Candidatus Omnitrophica bacterium]|nr:ATP-dependent DNA ligase [Candidatus Omnitrophota bacterium]
MSEKLIHKAIAEATGRSHDDIGKAFRSLGDYGEVTQQLSGSGAGKLEVTEVYERLSELSKFSGEGTVKKKVEFLAVLLREVSPLGAKYVVRIILGKLRLGVGDPTVLDALSLAYSKSKQLRPALERAYNLCSDLGLVADILFSKGIKAVEEFKVIVGCPIRVALAARLSSAEEIIDKIGVCAVEAKYDGFRCQVHKKGDEVQIFSRNLENTTSMFPEIESAARKQIKIKNAIFEGEALAYDPQTKECLAFQETVQRKRKYDIDIMQKRFPLKLFIFDLLFAGDDLTRISYEQRRKVLSGLLRKGDVLEISPVTIAHSAGELADVFEEAIAAGREGIVAKRLDSPYQAGGRNFNWIKLKRSYSGTLNDTIDCVIVGYFFGKGLRSSFGIGSLLACVYDQNEQRYKTIAKIGSGLSEEDLKQFKKKLDEMKIKSQPKEVDSLIQPDVWLTPKFVVEVQADEITRSPVHTCGKKAEGEPGFALRFPRTVSGIRIDKNSEDATTVDEISKIFSMQGRRT